MSDRPVSLNIPDAIEGQSAMNWITLILARNPLLSALYDYAYAVGARSTSLTIDAKESNLVAALEALPTFAPATPDAPKSVDEMAAEMGYTKCAHPACEGYNNNTSECVSERTIIRLHAEHTAPTKPPREMPAPEWTGPDRWQAWTGDTTRNPDDVGAPCPDGFVPIGAWTYEIVVVGDKGFRDWRRPLRRVQG